MPISDRAQNRRRRHDDTRSRDPEGTTFRRHCARGHRREGRPHRRQRGADRQRGTNARRRGRADPARLRRQPPAPRQGLPARPRRHPRRHARGAIAAVSAAKGHIPRVFAMAQDFGVDLDFHLDFDLDTRWRHLEEVASQTIAHGMQGRVTIGHVTKLSMLPPEALHKTVALMRDAGIALTVLPATDLFMTGRDHDHAAPRGVAPAHLCHAAGLYCTVATNNVLNPSPIRRLLAAAHGEPLCQCRPAWPARGSRRLFRHGDQRATRCSARTRGSGSATPTWCCCPAPAVSRRWPRSAGRSGG